MKKLELFLLGRQEKMKKKSITTKGLDKKIEKGEDLGDYFDTENATVRVNIDFPTWVVRSLDEEAQRRGIARQALVKMWLTDKLDGLKLSKKRTG